MHPKPIRSFARGLAVLEALNDRGSGTALALARHTSIPRATVYRLLQTLQDSGYIERGLGDDLFRLKLKVRRLSEGFEDEHWVAELARPKLLAVTKTLSWPCDILTFQNLHMVIRDTTHPVAPYSIDHNMVGRQIPILRSAAGLAYLAFAPAEERARIFERLAAAGTGLDLASAERVIATTRRQGFGIRQGGQVWPHTGAIALPIRRATRVLGCISIIWMSKVLDRRKGVQLCLEPLREAQRLIERDLS